MTRGFAAHGAAPNTCTGGVPPVTSTRTEGGLGHVGWLDHAGPAGDIRSIATGPGGAKIVGRAPPLAGVDQLAAPGEAAPRAAARARAEGS